MRNFGGLTKSCKRPPMKKAAILGNYFGLRFVATGEETNGRYFLSETTVPVGDSGPPPHSHQKEDEGFYVKSGHLIFEIEGEEIEIKEGEFLNIDKGKKHSWRNDSESDAEMTVIFAPAGIEKMFIELDKNPQKAKEIGLKFGTDFDI